jgi:pyruvoyl-dependent arginine decarboxylase (PvlArgDC)
MNDLILGNRVPYQYFITSGFGESDAGSKGLPYETGSYDEALTKAGIQNANIVEYTSVIPTVAKEISREEGLKRIQWGEVLESIKAQANGAEGEFISAAVMTTDVIDPNGKYLGGFACEYSGNDDRTGVEKSLEDSIAGIIERRNFGKVINGAKLYQENKTDKGYKFHPGKIFVYEGFKIKKHHGTALAAICFVSYKIPVINKSGGKRKTRKNRK